MAEYIERSYIRKMAMFEMAYTMETETDAAVVLRMIEDAPAADVAPVVHGRWTFEPETENTLSMTKCNVCGWWTLDPSVDGVYKYCPNCGAIMDGGDNNAAD